MLTEAQCKEVVQKKGFKSCRDLEYNWLGTDDQGRDLLARIIYGFRISVLFGLLLTLGSAVIGVACYLLLPNPVVAASAAVGLSIGFMHVARCIHPPGSATALGAVMNGRWAEAKAPEKT